MDVFPCYYYEKSIPIWLITLLHTHFLFLLLVWYLMVLTKDFVSLDTVLSGEQKDSKNVPDESKRIISLFYICVNFFSFFFSFFLLKPERSLSGPPSRTPYPAFIVFSLLGHPSTLRSLLKHSNLLNSGPNPRTETTNDWYLETRLINRNKTKSKEYTF